MVVPHFWEIIRDPWFLKAATPYKRLVGNLGARYTGIIP